MNNSILLYLQLENWQRIIQCSPAAWWNNSYNYSNSVPVPAKHTGVGSLALVPKRCKKDSWCANLHDFYKQALLFANCLSCRRIHALKGQCHETFPAPSPICVNSSAKKRQLVCQCHNIFLPSNFGALN